MTNVSAMFDLDSHLLIGQGANRVVYRHPTEPYRCIKIPKDRGIHTQALECDYYCKLELHNISWNHLSRYYGETETSLGKGYVYELIRDYNQTISLPLSYYLSTMPTKDIALDMLLKSLRQLKKFLIDNKIIIRNLRPYNILYKRLNQQEGLAVLIDNIGHHNNHYHLSDRIPVLARKDIQKKWKKFESSIQISEMPISI